MCTMNNRKPGHRGGRRKKTKQTRRENHDKVFKYEFEKETWGDELKFHDDWPYNMDTFRVVGCNLGGVSYHFDVKEWEVVLGHLYDLQSDAFCLSELNLNLCHPIVREKMFSYKHSLDRYMKLHYACSKPLDKNDQYQMGGVITGVAGRWSGRDVSLQLKLPVHDFGRWTVSHLKGKGSAIISVITIYRVCQQSNTGKNTIWIQQQRDIQNMTGQLVNPRNRFTDDISKVVQYLQSQSHHVVLCGDVNEDMNDLSSKNKWRNMLKACNLELVTDICFPKATLPATYERGMKCLDMVAVSSGINAGCIKAVGYLPLCDPLPSDHRAIYVDFDAEQLFGTQIPDLTKSSFRHFNTRNRKQTNKYLDALKKHYDNNKMFDKIKNLRDRILLMQEEQRDELIQECKRLEKKARELMVAAEKILYKGRYGSRHWSSSILKQAAHNFILLKKQRRHMYANGGYTNEEMETLEDDIAMAYVKLRECQKKSRETRDETLEYNANEMASEWNCSPDQVRKVLLNAEKSQKMFTKLKFAMKSKATPALKTLLVPRRENAEFDNAEHWTEIVDSEQIFHLLLEKNAESLMRSCQSVTATGPISENLGYGAEHNMFVENLFKGSIDTTELSNTYPGVRKELEAFLQSCTTHNAHEMEWNFGATEYQELFKKTRESTACGPSGLHMSHWKAASLDDDLSAINAFFMWAAFYLGFVYDRWLVSWHCMLLKKKQPYINKLRIIQLFEGDFNGMLKYLLGRKLMRHMVTTHQIDESAFGSIPGKDAKEAMKLLDMIMMNHRLMSRTLVTIFNDAAGCFDRIRPNMADFAMRRVGCPKSITATHTKAQLGMVHRVKTAIGVSDGSIKWHPAALCVLTLAGIFHFIGNIGGIGQGGGGSPVGWLVVLLIMIRAYKKFSPGATIIDPLGDNSSTLHVVSYVDDNSLLRSFDPSVPMDTIVQTVSKEVTSWWKLLKLTGGDLALEKCTYSIMRWSWSGYFNERNLILPSPIDGKVSVPQESGEKITLRCLDPTKAERQLGIRLSMEGNWNDEFQHRKKQVQQLCNRIYCAQLSQFEALMAYQFYIKSALYYALPLTVFSFKQCDELNKIILNRVLPKCGINRHTPRAVVYAPRSLGGFQFDHIWTKQLILHLEMMQRHLRRRDVLGKAYLCNLNCYQLLIGRSQCFLALDPSQHDYVQQDGCIGLMWTACYTLDIQCIIPSMIIPATSHPDDKLIMDAALQDPLVKNNRRKLAAINACRLYHGIISISNMYQYTGTRLNMGYLNGNGGRRIPSSNLSKWPVQPTPTKWQWETWKEFVCRNFLTGKREAIPLPPGSTHLFKPMVNLRCLIDAHMSVTFGSLQESVDALPPELRYYIGNLHIRESKINSFVNALRTGDLIGSSDGSAYEETQDGSYSYVLTIHQDATQVIYGGGKVAPHSNVTSQYTEHLGVIGLLMVLLSLQCCVDSTSLPPITIWIDNEYTQKRAITEPNVCDPISTFMSTDFDLWQLMLIIRDKLYMQVRAKWVKSHQDRTTPVKDLSSEAKMNVLADSVAAYVYQYADIQPQRTPHDDEGLFLAYKGARIYNIEESVCHIVHHQEYKNYICTKRNWKEEWFSSVYWRGLEAAVQKFKVSTRMNVIQLLHNWQNTGSQKKRFYDSQTLSKDPNDTSASYQYMKRHFRCPSCLTDVEDPLHFVFCEKIVDGMDSASMRRDLVAILRKHNTCDVIIDILVCILKGGDGNKYRASVSPSLSNAWHTAYCGQKNLGWNSFVQGFWHVSWGDLQLQHTQLLGETQRLDQWWKIVIFNTLEYVYNCWKLRNDNLHTHINSDTRTEDLHKRVRELYMTPDRFLFSTREKRRLFSMPMERRLRNSNATLDSWVDLVETRLRLDREEHSKRTLKRWLDDNN